MFCNNCGKEIDDDAKFCMHCGKPIEVKKAKKVSKDNKSDKPEIDNEKVDKILDEINDKDKIKLEKKKPLILLLLVIIIAVIIIIVVKNTSGINLKKIYNKVLDKNSSYSKYITLASDNSYIEVDTNPYNTDDYYSADAWELVTELNKELGFPESLENKMSHTRSIDGKQSEKNKNIEVTWTYHPDNGLEVQYTKSK